MKEIKIAIFFLVIILVIVLIHDWFSNQELIRMKQKYYVSNESLKDITRYLIEE